MPSETLLSVEFHQKITGFRESSGKKGADPLQPAARISYTPPSGSFTKMKGLTNEPCGWNADYTFDPFGMDKIGMFRNIPTKNIQFYPLEKNVKIFLRRHRRVFV